MVVVVGGNVAVVTVVVVGGNVVVVVAGGSGIVVLVEGGDAEGVPVAVGAEGATAADPPGTPVVIVGAIAETGAELTAS